MNYILDIVLLCVIFLFVAIGVRRGFIKSAAHFLGAVIAAFLASALGGAAAQWIYDALFRQALVERIGATVSSLSGQDAAVTAVQEFFGSLPDFIVRVLEDAGVTAAGLEGILATKAGATADLIADALSPVFVSFLKVLAVIVLFLLFMMLVRILADMVASLFYLPVLRQLDGLLGGVFGLLLVLVALWVAVSAVQVFLPMLDYETQAAVQNGLNRSLVAGLLIRLNPLGSMFR